MSLVEAAILTGGLHRCGSLDGFAERLYGNAWRRSDVLLRGGGRSLVLVLLSAAVSDHWPTLLILFF